MITLGQLKKSSIASIAACSPSSPTYVQLLNDAVRQLMDIGSWWSTVQTMIGCVYGRRIVWPCKIDAVLAVNIGHDRIALANHWFKFVHASSMTASKENAHIAFDGTTPLFRECPEDKGVIRFYITNPDDAGKTITVYGSDENGTPVVLPMILAATPVSTALLSEVTAITKDITAGEVKAYWFRAGVGLLEIAGVYRPNETAPEYLYSRLSRYYNGSCSSGDCKSIKALVKLGYEPMVLDTDICLIDNEDALKEMVQSIKRREAGDLAGANQFERSAIRRLNHQLKTRFPIDQIQVSVKPFGNDHLSHQALGMI